MRRATYAIGGVLLMVAVMVIPYGCGYEGSVSRQGDQGSYVDSEDASPDDGASAPEPATVAGRISASAEKMPSDSTALSPGESYLLDEDYSAPRSEPALRPATPAETPTGDYGGFAGAGPGGPRSDTLARAPRRGSSAPPPADSRVGGVGSEEPDGAFDSRERPVRTGAGKRYSTTERDRHFDESEESGSGDAGADEPMITSGHRPQQARPQTLTAGSFDDHQNLDDFRQFVSECQQNDPKEVLPRLAIGQRVLIYVRNGQDQPVAGARIQVRPVSDSSQPTGKTLVDVNTGSDGRALFLTGHDRGTTPSYQVTVTPPRGSKEVKKTFEAVQQPWEIVLPQAPSDVPTNLDLALVIDTTGSMSDELEYLKVEIDDIAARVQRMFPNVDVRFGLVVYRDEGDEYVSQTFDFSSSLSDFRGSLARHRANGGGDYPEAMHEALEKATELSWRDRDTARVLFLVGDAPPHDRYAARTVTAVEKLRQQGVRIYPVAASGVKQKAEYVMRSSAFLTLGQYLFLTDHSGVGRAHAAPHVPQYTVEFLSGLMFRMIASELAGRRLAPEHVIAIEQGDLDPADIEPEPIDQQSARASSPISDETSAWFMALTIPDWWRWPPMWAWLLIGLTVLGAGEAVLRRARPRAHRGVRG